MFKKLLFSLLTILPYYAIAQNADSPENKIYGPGVVLYDSGEVSADELDGVQVPIPRDIRILNTKGNCVWCSISVLGRYAEIEPLYKIANNMNQGGDSLCQGGSSPEPVRRYLTNKKIKFEMATNKRDGEALLIKSCKIDRRGCAFGIPGHMLNCVHYDPEKKETKVIDNADRSLRVQDWTWEKFHRQWDGWVVVIYNEPDIIPNKYIDLANSIPIEDYTNNPIPNVKNYIPSPKK